MTAAEIAALRERLAQYALDAENCHLSQGAADLRGALALLDAQAAEIARLISDNATLMDAATEQGTLATRLTAALEMARADAIEEAARVCDRLVSDAKSTGYPVHQGCFYEASRHIRALAPAPAAQAAEIARLTADLQAMYDRWAGAVRNLTDDDAPAPAAEVAG